MTSRPRTVFPDPGAATKMKMPVLKIVVEPFQNPGLIGAPALAKCHFIGEGGSSVFWHCFFRHGQSKRGCDCLAFQWNLFSVGEDVRDRYYLNPGRDRHRVEVVMNKILICLLTLVSLHLARAQEQVPLWAEGKTPFAKPIDKETGSPVLNLYPTKTEADNHNGAAVVICPGGGYGGLAVDHEGNQVAQWFNQRGVSAFVLHYRLGPQGHHFPTQLADVQRAVRWVRGHAEKYEVDPDRIAVMGFSAGGHLASMSATMFDEKPGHDPVDDIDKLSARPNFAILCYPVISMYSEFAHGGSRKKPSRSRTPSG